jgi:hypothetical protein
LTQIQHNSKQLKQLGASSFNETYFLAMVLAFVLSMMCTAKYCNVGKPYGNSCIASRKVCHQTCADADDGILGSLPKGFSLSEGTARNHSHQRLWCCGLWSFGPGTAGGRSLRHVHNGRHAYHLAGHRRVRHQQTACSFAGDWAAYSVLAG